jgi:hypothetical protein
MSVNLHYSSNINLDWTISGSPVLHSSGRRRSPAPFATQDSADGVAGSSPTALRENMLLYLGHVHHLAPAAGAPSSGSHMLSAGPKGNWGSVAVQQDIDRGSPLRPAPAGRGIRAWDSNDLTKNLTNWGYDSFSPPAYAIIRGGGQREASGDDASPCVPRLRFGNGCVPAFRVLVAAAFTSSGHVRDVCSACPLPFARGDRYHRRYLQGLDRRPLDSGEGPQRHLQSQVDSIVKEDKALIRLPDSRDNEDYKAARNPRFNAAEMREAGARLSSFEGEGGRHGSIIDYQVGGSVF